MKVVKCIISFSCMETTKVASTFVVSKRVMFEFHLVQMMSTSYVLRSRSSHLAAVQFN